jgi:sugar-specific transcriptional regulator TrmB
MDEAVLESIGLTNGEAKTYIALLRLGPSSTGPIAQASGVSTSKLYVILDKLEKKGLASHVEKSGVRRYQAVEPKKIHDYLQERRRELDRVEENLDKALPEMEAQYMRQSAVQSITVYQGFKGVMAAHEHTYLKLKRGDEYYVLGIPQLEGWDKRGFFEKDHERRSKAGIGCKMLFNSNVQKELVAGRNRYGLSDARFMPTDIRTPAYFTIYSDTTLIVIPSAETISIEIENKEVADAFKAYFDEFWGRTKPVRG